MVGVDLPLLLILLCGDVETNPGPLAPLARGPNLEKVSPRICHGGNEPLGRPRRPYTITRRQITYHWKAGKGPNLRKCEKNVLYHYCIWPWKPFIWKANIFQYADDLTFWWKKGRLGQMCNLALTYYQHLQGGGGLEEGAEGGGEDGGEAGATDLVVSWYRFAFQDSDSLVIAEYNWIPWGDLLTAFITLTSFVQRKF